jgi:hypothetical protein
MILQVRTWSMPPFCLLHAELQTSPTLAFLWLARGAFAQVNQAMAIRFPGVEVLGTAYPIHPLKVRPMHLYSLVAPQQLMQKLFTGVAAIKH